MGRGAALVGLGLVAAAGPAGVSFAVAPAGRRAGRVIQTATATTAALASPPKEAGGWATLCMVAAAACGARSAALAKTRRQAAGASADTSRRSLILPAAISAAVLPLEPVFAELDPSELPERINADPYDLIGVEDPDDGKIDKKEFYMKKDYRADTYQVLKHMKISGSLDKGTPRMERWNKRIKEEMDDWVALYRRQEAVVGRQSYYTLYSAVNTLASHFTSYGPKFPFPNKRRPRFYELIQTTEKYLEKNK